MLTQFTENINNSSCQEIYDKVLNHLVKQGKKSIDSYCKYRGPDNTSCAVGCLIPDDEYTPELEGSGGIKSIACSIKLNIESNKLDLLQELQILHDVCMSTTSFMKTSNYIAQQFSLTPFKFPENFKWC